MPKVNKKLHHEIYGEQKGKCYYCGKKMKQFYYVDGKATHETSTIDHKKPLARGGKHERENMVAACFECNNKKADKNYIKIGKRTWFI